MEIERKFWIKENVSTFEYEKMSIIKQCYINKPTDFYEIRLREYVDEDKYYIEFKSRGDLIREEFGTILSKEQYYKIYDGVDPNYFKNNSITKIRYTLKNNISYDVYQDKLNGLCILEVEGDKEFIENFKLESPWVIAIEVTYDGRFKNRNLSRMSYKNIMDFKEHEMIIINTIQDNLKDSKVTYRNDMEGVVNNMFSIYLKDKDKYGFEKFINIIFKEDEYDTDKLINQINNEFKLKYHKK